MFQGFFIIRRFESGCKHRTGRYIAKQIADSVPLKILPVCELRCTGRVNKVDAIYPDIGIFRGRTIFTVKNKSPATTLAVTAAIPEQRWSEQDLQHHPIIEVLVAAGECGFKDFQRTL